MTLSPKLHVVIITITGLQMLWNRGKNSRDEDVNLLNCASRSLSNKRCGGKVNDVSS